MQLDFKLRWQKYTKGLFKDDQELHKDSTGSAATAKQFEKAVKVAKNYKATGLDEISTNILLVLCNTIYND